MKSLNEVAAISILALVVAVESGMLANQTLLAQQAQTKSSDLLKDVKTSNLFRADVADMAGKEAIIQELEFPPEWSTGKHRHPGDTYVYILNGSMKLEEEGKAPVTVNRGEVFYESPNGVYNAISANGTKVLIVRIYEKGKPLSTPVK
jgi:quercetin dioxygenase-like cupin family protein